MATARWIASATAAVVVLLVALVAAAGAPVAARGADARALEGLARELVASLSAPARDPSHLADAADVLGSLVGRAREFGAGAETLRLLAGAGLRLVDAVGAERAAREERAGESEAALLTLYRSSDWQRLGYAAATGQYWRGWALLALGGTLAKGPERDAAFVDAQSAFASSARALALPELASASLLGLGLARLETGDLAAARGALEALAAQQSRGGGEPAATTLRALAAVYARAGDAELAARTAARIPPDSLTPEERSALAVFEAEEELRLLREGRGDPARAARVLRELANLGGDAARRANELAALHRDALTGHDVGAVGELLAADEALEAGRFEEARERYARVLAEPGRITGLDVARARERHAVSLHRCGRVLEAADEAERALAETNDDPRGREVARLWYALTEELAAREPGARSDTRAKRAAVALLGRSPDAPEADRARLRVARSRERGADARVALRELEQVPPASAAYPEARFELARLRADSLARSVASGATPDRDAARRLAADLDTVLELVAEGRLEIELSTRASLLVLRAEASSWSDDPSQEVLRRVVQARGQDGVDAAGRRTLLRLELSARIAQRDFAALEDALRALGDAEIRAGWPVFEEALAALDLARAPLDLRIAVQARLESLAPTDARPRVALLGAALLLEQGRHVESALRARELAEADPSWGDAWTLAARALEEAGDPAAVDLWARVAEGAEAGSPHWIDAWVAVARTAQRAGFGERACAALSQLDDAGEALATARRAELESAREACAAAGAPDAGATGRRSRRAAARFGARRRRRDPP
jgi:hypothetical protein